MFFTTNAKELVINSHHSRIPLNFVMKNSWLNLSLDIAGFFGHCFNGVTKFAIDGITLHAHCRLRRMFTMRGPIMDSTSDSEEFDSDLEMLPKPVEYPMGVVFSNQLYTPDKVSLNCPGERMLIEPIPMNGHKPVKTVPLEFVKGSNRVERNAVEGTLDKPKGKPFNMTANHQFHKQSMNTGMGSSQSTQDSVLKRSSRFESAKRVTHGHILKTPELNVDNDSLATRSKNGMLNLKALRDSSEPPLRVSKNNLMTSYEKGSSKCSKDKRLSKAAANPMMSTHKDTTPKKPVKPNSKKQMFEINNYCGNSGKAPASKNSNKCQPKAKAAGVKANPKPARKNPAEEVKNSPSTMLLQSIGAKQLNTFNLPDKGECSSDEIEEQIETDDKSQVKEAEKCITPL
eukprot:TRINITY_DN11373_c0_g3_i2.p1 TRINITY_DN11373_c0_g3~~TRINITY_DN11373_c0_g3_i2.p1  ORF type:complete len:400 (+),score=105.23 TRINITY_DN11373_c0_g3_i2:421-1620(+)